MNYNGQSNTNTNTNVPIPHDKLTFIGGVLFGSRAISAATRNSDYDYAVQHSVLETLLENELISINTEKLTDCFDVVPGSGNNYLIKSIKFEGVLVDLVVLEHKKHVDMFRTITEIVKENHSKILLKNKDYRAKAYKSAMLKAGFVRNGYLRRLWYSIF